MRTTPTLATIALVLILARPSSVIGSEPQRYEFSQPRMGVLFRITLYAAGEAAANEAAQAAFKRIADLDETLTNYDGDSELLRMCRSSGPGRPIAVGNDLMQVLSHAQSLSRQTDGAFDVTIGPIAKLWRKARRRKELPDSDRLALERKRVGWQYIQLSECRRTVELARSDMLLDLGGIAKGFAADEALNVLKQHGIAQAMVDGSGDIALGEPPPGRTAWKIGIAPLAAGDGKPSRFLLLANCAVATSGDAFQHVEVDGTRYSHIIDPKTGLGLTTPSSVTVVAPNCMSADALASAVSVLGPKRGVRFIEQQRDNKTAVLVMTVATGKPKLVESKTFGLIRQQRATHRSD